MKDKRILVEFGFRRRVMPLWLRIYFVIVFLLAFVFIVLAIYNIVTI